MDIHPKLTSVSDSLYRVSAKAVIIRDSKLLMVYEPDEGYSLPGGGIDYGEDIAATLARELEEELGIASSQLEISLDVLFTTSKEIIRSVPRFQLYYRTNLVGDILSDAPAELTYEWVDTETLKQLELTPATSEALDDLLTLLTNAQA